MAGAIDLAAAPWRFAMRPQALDSRQGSGFRQRRLGETAPQSPRLFKIQEFLADHQERNQAGPPALNRASEAQRCDGKAKNMTALEDAPLLQEPDLMLAVLRVAAVKTGTLDDCIAHLRALRRCAQIEEPMPEAEVRAMLKTVEAKLYRAGLIDAPALGRFRITARGRQVLDDNPDGVDDTVLMRLPEFRPVNGHPGTASAVPTAPAAAPGTSDTEYRRGFEAALAGASLADNPHPPDVRAYLDWENGWSQGRDHKLA